jgi:hypothetical protein
MMRTARCARRLCLAALALSALAFPGRTAGQPYEPDATGTLLYGALVGAQLGAAHAFSGGWGPTGEMEFLSVGWGRAWGNNGFMVAARALEIAPSGYSGDYMFSAGFAPLYVYAVRGVSGRASSSSTALHAFVGGAFLVPYEMPYLQAGVGAKWRYYVISPEVLLTWRSQWHAENRPAERSDILSLCFRLELGGWWRFDRDD